MRTALVVFDGFDDLSAFVTLGLLNRIGAPGWKAGLAAPASHITSMNGVTVAAQHPIEFANEADAVVFCGGLYGRAIAENGALLDRLQLDPVRQLVAAHDSGTLLLARLGLLADVPACTDAATKPWLVQAGVRVVDAEAFHARGGVATAGGALSAQYVAAWLLARGAGLEAAASALQLVAPTGDREAHAARVLAVVRPFVSGA